MNLLNTKDIGPAKKALAQKHKWARTTSDINESKNQTSNSERVELCRLCYSLVDDINIIKYLKPEQHHASHWARAASIVQNYQNDEGEMVST